MQWGVEIFYFLDIFLNDHLEDEGVLAVVFVYLKHKMLSRSSFTCSYRNFRHDATCHFTSVICLSHRPQNMGLFQLYLALRQHFACSNIYKQAAGMIKITVANRVDDFNHRFEFPFFYLILCFVISSETIIAMHVLRELVTMFQGGAPFISVKVANWANIPWM